MTFDAKNRKKYKNNQFMKIRSKLRVRNDRIKRSYNRLETKGKGTFCSADTNETQKSLYKNVKTLIYNTKKGNDKWRF